MKNVKKEQLKQCIFLSLEEYTNIIKQCFDEETKVVCSNKGIFVYKTNEIINNYDICDVLAKYFDVNQITSVHIDDSYYTGVWIAYKEN